MKRITSRYITATPLQREFGLARSDAAAIIRAETARVRWNHRYRIGAVIGLLCAAFALSTTTDDLALGRAGSAILLVGVIAATVINIQTRRQAQPAILAAARALAHKD